MAGVACWVFSYPSDVIKTRMQADGLNGVKQYRNTWHCYQMAKMEGGSMFNPRSAFWVGFCPTALRAFPGEINEIFDPDKIQREFILTNFSSECHHFHRRWLDGQHFALALS